MSILFTHFNFILKSIENQPLNDFFPKFSILMIRKRLHKLRDILWDAWPALFKMMKVIQNKKTLRNCHSQGNIPT